MVHWGNILSSLQNMAPLLVVLDSSTADDFMFDVDGESKKPTERSRAICKYATYVNPILSKHP